MTEKELLEEMMIALDDWLNTYANVFCDKQRVVEANKRISENGGTIAYIAKIREKYNTYNGNETSDSKQCCNYYQTGLDKINAPIILQSVRDSSYIYDGRLFKYCPWCGKKLKPLAQNDK
jgi:hypothetical protein